MIEYTTKEIDDALIALINMSHYEMCRLWRFAPTGSEIYFRSDLITGVTFKHKLFEVYGGFTPEISKELGW